MSDNNNSRGSFWTTFLIGAAAGAAAGWYLRSESGQKLLSDARTKAIELERQASAQANQTIEQLGKTYENVRTQTQQTVDQAKVKGQQLVDTSVNKGRNIADKGLEKTAAGANAVKETAESWREKVQPNQ